MTYWGTNSYIVGQEQVAVIDPGPEDEAHLDAILRATAGERVTKILITHAHSDHSPLARTLAERTGAAVLGFGPPEAGRNATMQGLAKAGLAGGGEGVDSLFRPDIQISDGDVVSGKDWELEVVHSPGHFAGHLAFRMDDVVFSGDHVMDWSSSLVSPPDGNVRDFMQTSERLASLGARRFLPGHGPDIQEPEERLSWLITHRQARADAILDALGTSPQSVEELARTVYTDTPPEMLPAASRNVFAHLIDMVERGLATANPELGLSAGFSRT
ncbi:MAG: MBL fold metallo-hydrolase [Boseongicola sp. SB0676_bin_33]|nr:MBL fold metallo-hydrolase [Boseongicola sp. SB0676_bin_33]